MPNDKLWVVAQRPNEAAKMFAMYLLHTGVLCEYSKGNKPPVITVSTASLLVDFKAWFGSREFQDTRSKGATIILEPCFVKKVIFKSFLWYKKCRRENYFEAKMWGMSGLSTINEIEDKLCYCSILVSLIHSWGDQKDIEHCNVKTAWYEITIAYTARIQFKTWLY